MNIMSSTEELRTLIKERVVKISSLPEGSSVEYICKNYHLPKMHIKDLSENVLYASFDIDYINVNSNLMLRRGGSKLLRCFLHSFLPEGSVYIIRGSRRLQKQYAINTLDDDRDLQKFAEDIKRIISFYTDDRMKVRITFTSKRRRRKIARLTLAGKSLRIFSQIDESPMQGIKIDNIIELILDSADRDTWSFIKSEVDNRIDSMIDNRIDSG